MMNKNLNSKSKKMTLLTICVLAVLIISGIFAYLTDTDDADNIFTVGKIDIQLNEEAWDEDNAVDFVANQSIDKNPSIENIGKNDAYVFLKVRVPMVKDAAINANNTDDVQHQTLSQDAVFEAVPAARQIGGDIYREMFTLQKNTGTELAPVYKQLVTSTETSDSSKITNADWFEVTNYVETNEAANGNTVVYLTHVYAYKTAIAKTVETSTLFDQIKVSNFTGNADVTVDQIEGASPADGQHILLNAYAVQSGSIEETNIVNATADAATSTGTIAKESVIRALWRTQFSEAQDQVNGTNVNLSTSAANKVNYADGIQ